MVPVSTKELSLINELHARRYDVKLYQVEGGFSCSIILQALEPVEERKVMTFRGEEKKWRLLQDAISFVKEHCPDCRQLTVEYEGYILNTSP